MDTQKDKYCLYCKRAMPDDKLHYCSYDCQFKDNSYFTKDPDDSCDPNYWDVDDDY